MNRICRTYESICAEEMRMMLTYQQQHVSNVCTTEDDFKPQPRKIDKQSL